MELVGVLITPDLNKWIVALLPGGPPVWLMEEEEPVLSTSLLSDASLRGCISSYSCPINLPRLSPTHLWQNLQVFSMLQRDISSLSRGGKKKRYSFPPATAQLLVNWCKSSRNTLLTDECGVVQSGTSRGLRENERKTVRSHQSTADLRDKLGFSVYSENPPKPTSLPERSL